MGEKIREFKYNYVDVPLFAKDSSEDEEVISNKSELDKSVDVRRDVERLSGIPVKTIQTFKELQERRIAMTTKSVQKLERLSNKQNKRKKRRRGKNNDGKDVGSLGTSLDKTSAMIDATSSLVEAKWEEVRQLLDVNGHLIGPVDHGVCQPKSGTEAKVNDAITEGDFDGAELISDQLAARDFSVRAAQAFAAKRYLDEKEEAKKKRLMKAKAKPHWGFEAKQRWEMKGNM